MYTNNANTDAKILVSATGRTGILSGTDTGSVTMALYSSGSLISDYGWTPADQDSKALSGIATVNANNSAYITLKGAKSSDATGTVGVNMQISVIGVAYGS